MTDTGLYFPAAVRATTPGGPGGHTLELWVRDLKHELVLPANPRDELLLSRHHLPQELPYKHEYVLLNEPGGSLTVRVWDPSTHVMYFRATGDAIKHLRSVFTKDDEHILKDLDDELTKRDHEANPGDYEDEIISADSFSVSADIGGPLVVDEILEVPRTFIGLIALINRAVNRPDYDPRTAWRVIQPFYM